MSSLLSFVMSLFSPVIHLRISPQPISGRLLVYISDPQLARAVSHLTGGASLRPRHFLALRALGYRFHLPRHQAVTVPAWLPAWLTPPRPDVVGNCGAAALRLCSLAVSLCTAAL